MTDKQLIRVKNVLKNARVNLLLEQDNDKSTDLRVALFHVEQQIEEYVENNNAGSAGFNNSDNGGDSNKQI